ncbi:BgTH12-04391 [Blumeria graminis f. sp. triticale]|uniref:Bgt-51938 n=2 Tax=Blumeria graminis TaxID=34373 RepID=A0A9X9PQ57_BLUGR|nr:BgTH12-04391 [Blumeria graminis f. sp. triticale]VCU38828.1 Bgt-51938 [Blumeria graminis f. sp. tritici]
MGKHFLISINVLLHTYLHITSSSASPTALVSSPPEVKYSDYICDDNYLRGKYLKLNIEAAWIALYNSEPTHSLPAHVGDSWPFASSFGSLFVWPILMENESLGTAAVSNVRIIINFRATLVGIVTVHQSELRYCQEVFSPMNSDIFDPNLHSIIGFKCDKQVFEYDYVYNSYSAALKSLQTSGLKHSEIYPRMIIQRDSPYHNFAIWPLLSRNKIYTPNDENLENFVAFKNSPDSLNVFHLADGKEFACPIIWKNFVPTLSIPSSLINGILDPKDSQIAVDCNGQMFKHKYIEDNLQAAIRGIKHQQAGGRPYLYPQFAGDDIQIFGSRVWKWPLRHPSNFFEVRQPTVVFFLTIKESKEFHGVYFFKDGRYSACKFR